MSIDYHDLYNNILRVVATALYRLEHPITGELTATEINMQDQHCIDAYRDDPIFHAKCKQLSSVIVNIVHYHEDISALGKDAVVRGIEEQRANATLLLRASMVSSREGLRLQKMLFPVG